MMYSLPVYEHDMQAITVATLKMQLVEDLTDEWNTLPEKVVKAYFIVLKDLMIRGEYDHFKAAYKKTVEK